MSEASYLVELRQAAPAAPERLREVVAKLPQAEPRQTLRFRPALAGAVILTAAIGLTAAVIGGLNQTGSEAQSNNAATRERLGAEVRRAKTYRPPVMYAPSGALVTGGAAGLTAKSRLQRQDVAMRLRVKDLSGATQRAVRTTRRLGGFVAGADYATGSKDGNSRLALRVPVANLQKAIVSFTNLGTILSQHISVADLQTGLDRLDSRIARARREGKERTLARLERRREALIREGTYARVSLHLTTVEPAEQHAAPGRFDRFWDTTGDILGKELIAVLYAIFLAGPFVLVAALLILAERTRRRRADHRLLEEAG